MGQSQIIATDERSKPADIKPRRRWIPGRMLLIRLALSLAVLLITVKVADIVVGWTMDTPARHLFVLTPSGAFRHRSSEYDYVYHTNSHGLRGSEISVDKPQGTTRIVVLGDSFVAGVGVEDEKVFAVRLEQLLNRAQSNTTPGKRVEVINGGLSGSSTTRQWELYNHSIRRLKPDVVVLAFFLGNDLTDIVQESSPEERAAWHPPGLFRRLAYFWCPNLYLELAIWKRNAKIQKQITIRDDKEILKALYKTAQLRNVDPQLVERRFLAMPAEVRSPFTHRISHACLDPSLLRQAMHPDDEFIAQAWPRVKKSLGLLRDDIRDDGARMFIVALPDPSLIEEQAISYNRKLGYNVDPSWLKTECRTEKLLRHWSEQHKIPYLDLTEPMRRSEQSLFFLINAHFNDAGHELAARQLARLLQEHGAVRIDNR